MSWDDLIIWAHISTGAVFGSLKAIFSTTTKHPVYVNLLNFIISFYCGIACTTYFTDKLTFWQCGLLALVVSALAVAIIDNIQVVLPQVLTDTIKKLVDFFIKK